MNLESSKGGTNGVTPADSGGIIPAKEVVNNDDRQRQHAHQQPTASTLPTKRSSPGSFEGMLWTCSHYPIIVLIEMFCTERERLVDY